MGFRSYIRHFRGAILGLLRPSEAWCFPAGRQVLLLLLLLLLTTTGFRSYVRHFWGAILGLLRPSEAWCFPAGRWFFPWCFPSGNLLLLLWVSEVTLGIFGVQFWGFSVLQRHGVSLPAGDFFHGVFHPGTYYYYYYYYGFQKLH